MGVFDLIRAVFGLGGSDEHSTTDVPIEPERRETDDSGSSGSGDASAEPGRGEESAAAGTDATASTDSTAETPSSDPDTAAEPAETDAGVTEHGGTQTPPAEVAEGAGSTPDDASTDSDGSDDDFEYGSDTTSEDTASEDARNDDVTSEDVADDANAASVETISGIGPAYAERLADAGVETVPQLLDADPSELAEATGLSEKRIAGWLEQAGE